MDAPTPAYFEMIDFIAKGPTTEEVSRYAPSAVAKQWVSELIARQGKSGLSEAERYELRHFVELELILTMAKEKALQILDGADRGQSQTAAVAGARPVR